ncbi:MAG: hypothetical protein IT307_02730 [Chloroflexi bacterium]|nr:hypothetical protein [Chloroflexota bacterium]
MPDNDDIRYDRLCRTPSSEAYLLSRGDEPLGRLELHFSTPDVHGLLILEQEMAEPGVLELIGKLDEDLVWSAGVPREDFIVTVYHGTEIGIYSDPREEDFDLEEGNGSKG